MIDPSLLNSEVKYEEYENSGNFLPHVYGYINSSSVVQVVNFPPQPDGTFKLPVEVTTQHGIHGRACMLDSGLRLGRSLSCEVEKTVTQL